MQRVSRWIVHAAEAVLATMLAVMLLMVTVNVVMRYGFNTGISATEELSRALLVWLTFTGAVLAAYEGTHLGMGSLIDRLPAPARSACLIASELLVVVCCVLIFYGTLRQHEVNATNKSLTTGMAMIWIYGIGYVASLGIGLISAWRLGAAIRAALGRATAGDPVLDHVKREAVL